MLLNTLPALVRRKSGATSDLLAYSVEHRSLPAMKAALAGDPLLLLGLLDQTATTSVPGILQALDFAEISAAAAKRTTFNSHSRLSPHARSSARHTIFVASMTELFITHQGGTLGEFGPEEGFCIGALHELGLIQLLLESPDQYRSLAEFAEGAGESFDLAYESIDCVSLISQGAKALDHVAHLFAFAEVLAHYDEAFSENWPEIRCALQLAHFASYQSSYSWEPWIAKAYLMPAAATAYEANEGLCNALAERATAFTNEWLTKSLGSKNADGVSLP